MSPETKNLVGTRIREAREARGWTQGDLAERAKTSRSWVAAVECGWLQSPSARFLLRVADALGVDRASLIFFDEG